MALSDEEIQATKVPYGKNQFKISDGSGLYLLVKSSGRYWKLAYRFEGKQKTLAFGVYPAVGVDEARCKRDTAKELLAQNIDPGQIRKQERIEQREASQTQEMKPTETVLLPDNGSRMMPSPIAVNPEEQKIIEHRRLNILLTLAAADAYAENERSLQHALDRLEYHISFDRLRTDIAWLYEQQLVHMPTGLLWTVYLTQSGLDAARGRMWIPGIHHPNAGERKA